jgi:hypothetical protein
LSVEALSQSVELETATRKYANGERHGEVPLKREHDCPHQHPSAQRWD